jgi:hypothetical protein
VKKAELRTLIREVIKENTSHIQAWHLDAAREIYANNNQLRGQQSTDRLATWADIIAQHDPNQVQFNEVEVKKSAKPAGVTYTLNQLNTLAKGSNKIVLVEYDGTVYTLKYFAMEEDDMNDSDEKVIAAHVEEMGEWLPVDEITRFFVASPVKVI